MLSSPASCSRVFSCINATFDRMASPTITFFAGLMLLCVVTATAWATNATATTLAVRSAGGVVTTVTAGSVITLTASVTMADRPVTTGQVYFCDATAPRCTDIHLLGLSQLTQAGSAFMSFRPGIGSFSYKALFIPSGGHSGSASSALPLTVAGTSVSRTETTFASTGILGNYLFEAKVVATEGLIASPTGSVSFLDTSSNNKVISTAELGPSRAGVTFVNPSTPEVSLIPHGIVAADFNADGIPDFAASNLGDDVVTIELGNGDANFTTMDSSPATGSLPWGIVAGDFNGDGKMDLAVANSNGNTITVLLGEGDGHFTTAASPATGNTPLSLATGDFNEDGNQDLAVSNYGDGTLTILLGNGNGMFTAATSSPIAGMAPEGISVGGFNNDGHLDLAVADLAGQVQILLGDGDTQRQEPRKSLFDQQAGGIRRLIPTSDLRPESLSHMWRETSTENMGRFATDPID
jgi:trimeric autotransporter adhesin